MILSSVVAMTIKQKIITGEYAVGERLPNEMELAKQLGVSRPTVREAIKTLVSKNIVTIERGRGTFVNDPPGIVDDPLGLEFVPEDVMIRDLNEARYYFEPYVAALAARRAEKRQLVSMGGVIANMLDCGEIIRNAEAYDEAALSDARERFSNCELLFHALIYEMSGNALIKRLQPAIIQSIHTFYVRQRMAQEYDYALACVMHERIFHAIQSADARQAYRCALEHMLLPEEVLFSGSNKPDDQRDEG